MTPKRKLEKVEQLLKRLNISPKECIAIGDSASEVPVLKYIGKERSIGFNCRESLKPYVKYIAYEFGDPKRNLMMVLKIIKKIEAE